jgi:hypothetical protein
VVAVGRRGTQEPAATPDRRRTSIIVSCRVVEHHCSLNSAVRPRALPRGVPPRFLRLACRGVHRTLRPAARRHGRGWRTRRRLDARLRAGVVVISYYIFPHYLIRGEFKFF